MYWGCFSFTFLYLIYSFPSLVSPTYRKWTLSPSLLICPETCLFTLCCSGWHVCLWRAGSAGLMWLAWWPSIELLCSLTDAHTCEVHVWVSEWVLARVTGKQVHWCKVTANVSVSSSTYEHTFTKICRSSQDHTCSQRHRTQLSTCSASFWPTEWSLACCQWLMVMGLALLTQLC